MSQRSEKVAEELRKIISMILLDDLSDPRMGFVTITRIQLTNDLRFARVYYSVLGSEEAKQQTMEAMAENLGFIKRLAIERLNMKFAPELRFEVDTSIDHGFHIDAILKRIKKEKGEP